MRRRLGHSRVTPELILVAIGLWLAFLLNVLVRVLRRVPGDAPRESGPEAPQAPARLPTPPLPPGARRGGAVGSAPDIPLPPPTDVLEPRRRPKVRIRRAPEVRRGIVLMAVLGPCRGLEPPGFLRRGGLDA